MFNQKQSLLYTTITSLAWKGVLRVSGPGGTGKTFTVAKSLKDLIGKEPEIKVAVCTPTHQALATIKEKICPSIADRIDFMTAAKMLSRGLFSPQLGTKVATRGNTRRVALYDIIVIDESSMVGKSDSEMFLAQLSLSENVRIIEMGDFYQLPPVLAKRNVFDSAKNFTEIQLDEQMRNGGEILRVATKCRNEIYYPEVSRGNVLVHDSQESIVREFIKKVKTLDNPTDAIFLAATNKKVAEMAELVHKELYGDADFVIGQWLRLEENINVEAKGHNVQILDLGQETTISGVPAQEILVQGHSGSVEWIECVKPKSNQLKEAKLAELLAQVKLASERKDAETVQYLSNQYRDLEERPVEVSSPFSLTIHKSQGQTVPFVFVDTLDVKKGRGGSKKNLLYVAYSRAAKELNTVAIPKPAPGVSTIYQQIRQSVPVYSKMDKEIRARLGKGVRLNTYAGRKQFIEVYAELCSK